MEKIKIGIMGCANIARRSMIPAIKSLKDEFELVSIASRTMDKASALANEFDCKPAEGYESLVDDDDIEAIYMPLPTGLHREWIGKCLRAGKHVYAEKSISMNQKDASEMVEMARSNGCALMEGYMFQYHDQHQIVKKLLTADEIGELRQYRATFAFPPFADKNNFRYDNNVGGGALKDAAGYVARSVEFLFPGKFSLINSSVHYDPLTGTSIYGSAYMKADDGINALLSFGFDNFYQCNYEILGTKGKITARKAFTPKPDETTFITLEQQGEIQEIKCQPCNHFVNAMRRFHRACSGDNREELLKQILKQSELLDAIELKSKES